MNGAFDYLIYLANIQGVPVKLSEDGKTLNIGPGTIILPRNKTIFGNDKHDKTKIYHAVLDAILGEKS